MARKDNKLRARPIRLAGIAVTATMMAALLLLVARRSPPPSDEAAPRRGGQIVASVSGDPGSFNPLAAHDDTSEVLAYLTHAPLIRVNRATSAVEPWLADAWESSGDGRVHTLRLHPDSRWSDGVPFTADDVVFSARAVFTPGVSAAVAERLMVGGQPIRAASRDSRTVVITFPSPYGAGAGLLDRLPILPKHKLERALAEGTLTLAWGRTTPVAEIVGMGPFVLSGYVPGERIVLDRNPHYWRRAPDGGPLPYLDRVVLQIASPGTSELPLLTSAAVDLPSDALSLDEYATVRLAQEEGRVDVIELGVSPAPDALWFCLKPEIKSSDPRFAFLDRVEFRQAISHAVDREAFAETVFDGAAVPIWGPITPGHQDWFWPDVVRYRPDLSRARELLAGIGLADRDGNGVLEDPHGIEARFAVLTERGIRSYERGTAVLRASLQRIGVAASVTPLDQSTLAERVRACDFDAVYHQSPVDHREPVMDLSFWLSSGQAHVWNPRQRAPATDWERRIDTLVLEQAASTDLERRRQQFILVQRIFAEQLPMLYFAAPRLYYAHSVDVRGVVPSVWRPYVLWNAETLHRAP